MTLTAILNHLIARAERSPGQLYQHHLENDLRITIKQTDKALSIGLSRAQVYPSPTEWRTISRFLQPLGRQLSELTKVKTTGRHWLTGTIEKLEAKELSHV